MTPISIILPVLDEGEGLLAALAPLQSWRARGHQIILADGGSRDGGPERAAALCDQVVHAPRGRGSQMNAGARQARHDTLLFLHADTCLPEGADAAIAAATAEGHSWGRFDVRIEGRSPLLPLVSRLMNLRSRLTGIATGDQALFIGRDLFTQVGGFADIPLMEDIELTQRLRAIARPACLAQHAKTSGRRWDRHGALRTIFLMWHLRAAFHLGADPHRLALKYGYAPRGD